MSLDKLTFRVSISPSLQSYFTECFSSPFWASSDAFFNDSKDPKPGVTRTERSPIEAGAVSGWIDEDKSWGLAYNGVAHLSSWKPKQFFFAGTLPGRGPGSLQICFQCDGKSSPFRILQGPYHSEAKDTFITIAAKMAALWNVPFKEHEITETEA